MEKNKYSKAILYIVAGLIIYFAPRFMYNLLAFALFALGIYEILKVNDINVLDILKSGQSTDNLNGSKLKFKMNNKVLFTIIGAILGLPFSYYFQSDMLKAYIGGISGYIKKLGDVIEEEDLIGNVIIGILVFAIIGFAIGFFMDKKRNIKQN